MAVPNTHCYSGNYVLYKTKCYIFIDIATIKSSQHRQNLRMPLLSNNMYDRICWMFPAFNVFLATSYKVQEPHDTLNIYEPYVVPNESMPNSRKYHLNWIFTIFYTLSELIYSSSLSLKDLFSVLIG